jgi:DNA polymerase-3 subunit epsilon
LEQCHGACVGEESVESYNERVQTVIERMKITFDQNFILLDKGRSPDEKAVIVIENDELSGFGYVAVDEAVSNPHDLKQYIKPYPSNADAIRIIRMFLDEKKGLKKIVF